jgi:hypothetical protein
MARCPKCRQDIPFYGVFVFQKDFYRCLKCNAPYIWTWASSFFNLVISYLFVIIVAIIAVALFEIAKMSFYSTIFVSLVIGVVLFGLYSYIWWRFFIKLQEPSVHDEIGNRLSAIIAVLAVLYVALRIFEKYFLQH